VKGLIRYSWACVLDCASAAQQPLLLVFFYEEQ
jgi:hypothetical protein